MQLPNREASHGRTVGYFPQRYCRNLCGVLYVAKLKAYRGVRCALVLVMPARLRDAISGILAGGIPGFGIATFCLLSTLGHLVMFGFVLLL